MKVESCASPCSGDVRHSLASLDRIGDILGYAPVVDVREGLRRTMARHGGAASATGRDRTAP